MPSSTWVHTSTICDLVWKYRPKTILDIGVGFGRWGFICREMLDTFQGRPKKQDWQAKISGIEIFPLYLEAHQQHLYDEIIVGCALKYLEQNKQRRWDLVIAGDVIEHFGKEDARKLLSLLHLQATRAVILCVPLGDDYRQGAACNNEHERHLSTWNVTDFKNDYRVTRVTTVRERIKNRPYGIVLMEKKQDGTG